MKDEFLGDNGHDELINSFVSSINYSKLSDFGFFSQTSGNQTGEFQTDAISNYETVDKQGVVEMA